MPESQNNLDKNIIYLAGIIDGEGHFHKPMTVNGRGEKKRYPRLVIGNTNKDLIDWLKNNYGGCIVKIKKQQPYHLQAWSWSLQGKKAVELATKVKPYLIVKREQVKCMF